jgi:hypothetical protein
MSETSRTSQTIQRDKAGDPKTKTEISNLANRFEDTPNSPGALADMVYKQGRFEKFAKEMKVCHKREVR